MAEDNKMGIVRIVVEAVTTILVTIFTSKRARRRRETQKEKENGTI